MDIMLDIESWGTDPGCDIRSIGACVFDPVTGWIPHEAPLAMGKDGRPFEPTFYVACDNPQYGWNAPKYKAHGSSKYPLHRDPRTVQWWSKQSDEAQAAFADPVDLRSALASFTSWLYRIADESGGSISERTDIRLWSHGSHFDIPILAAAYAAVGLPVPWHYRAPRDTRTIFDVAGIDDHSAWLAQHPGPLGVSHHALDDAICQARAVCAAWERLHNDMIGYEQ